MCCSDRGTSVAAEGQAVIKWGNRLCGEDKARFDGTWTASVPTLFEDFIEGEAVRIVLVAGLAWQVGMAGEVWLEVSHDPRAALVEIDSGLVEEHGGWPSTCGSGNSPGGAETDVGVTDRRGVPGTDRRADVRR